MNNFEFDELIEKAFSMGYEYALEDIKYFSEEEEKEKKKEKKKTELSGLGAVGGIAGGLAINTIYGDKFYKDLNDTATKESSELYNTLKDNLKKKRISIDDEHSFKMNDVSNAAYFQKMKGIRNMLAKKYKNAKKNGDKQGIKNTKDLKEIFETVIPGAGKGKVIIDKDLKGRADILAHEMGHQHYMDGDGKKSLGGVLHSQLLRNPLIGATNSIAAGIHSGIKSRKAENEGKKESKWNKYKSVIIPGIHAAGLIGSEAAASMKGYKMLKELGADADTLKDAKRRLGNALGTYAGIGLAQVGFGLGGRAIGKALIPKKKKKKEDKENSED